MKVKDKKQPDIWIGKRVKKMLVQKKYTNNKWENEVILSIINL